MFQGNVNKLTGLDQQSAYWSVVAGQFSILLKSKNLPVLGFCTVRARAKLEREIRAESVWWWPSVCSDQTYSW